MGSCQLSDDAQHDLWEIRDYTISRWGKKQARQYLMELTDKFELIASNPRMGRAREEIAHGLRSIAVGHHVIFYRKKMDGVEIARVLHPSMDIERQFE